MTRIIFLFPPYRNFQVKMLMNKVAYDEIESVVKFPTPWKAPRLIGWYRSAIYQLFWMNMKDDIIHVIMKLFVGHENL